MTALYPKYVVTRTDGDPTGKHARCVYFVLDLGHDEHALAAIRAYAKSCKTENPELAAELRKVADYSPPSCSCREVSCPHSLARAFSPEDPADLAAEIIRDNLKKKGT